MNEGGGSHVTLTRFLFCFCSCIFYHCRVIFLTDVICYCHPHEYASFEKKNKIGPVVFSLISINYHVDIKELSPENKESCDGLLDINECKVSLDKMANNKSPGCDGLTAEFYKRHWNLVGQLVVNSLKLMKIMNSHLLINVALLL